MAAKKKNFERQYPDIYWSLAAEKRFIDGLGRQDYSKLPRVVLLKLYIDVLPLRHDWSDSRMAATRNHALIALQEEKKHGTRTASSVN